MEVQIQKSCCARFYEQQELKLLLGDYWHPGGPDLTLELGHELQIESKHQVLDIASGLGSTGALLAKNFQCNVTCVDLSKAVLSAAKTRTSDFAKQLSFCGSDAESLPFRNEVFEAVLSECSLCIFPSKERAAREMFRVLNRNGRAGISDMTLEGKLPDELGRALYEFLCVAEARPKHQYYELFAQAGFVDIKTRDESDALLILLENLGKALFAAELLIGLKKVTFSTGSLNRAKSVLKEVTSAAKNGTIGYIAMTASKP